MESFTRSLSALWVRGYAFAQTRRRDLLVGTLLTLLISASYVACAAPSSFTPTTVRIDAGTNLPTVAEQLGEAGVVSHPLILRLILRLSGESGHIRTGAYRFNTPQNVFTIADRLVTGAYGLPMTRITFIEGITVREAGEQVAASLLDITPDTFAAAAAGKEGYLFPDTYFFQPSADAVDVVKTMRANFTAQIAPLTGQIASSGHSLADIVTMASLVEKEARTSEDRKMVAGILWNRIKKGMPLQVDAVFGYIFNRDTYSPSYADLKVDSPYNTYTHQGLPPGPICNPGLDAIEAALNPTPSDYLYYLTDKNGVMHYAQTYAAQLTNEKKYLRP